MPICYTKLIPGTQIAFDYYNDGWIPVVGQFEQWNKTQTKMLVSGRWYSRFSCNYLRTAQ